MFEKLGIDDHRANRIGFVHGNAIGRPLGQIVERVGLPRLGRPQL
jgi:hypothetical protein